VYKRQNYHLTMIALLPYYCEVLSEVTLTL
jgi:hypothetical protein